MNNSDLRKLGRRELLEILLEQTKRIEELENELDDIKTKYDAKVISINETGSLAEASLKLTDIFKAADEAVALYMKNAMDAIKREEKKKKKELKEMKTKMLEEVEQKCQKRELKAEKRLKQLEVKIEKVEKEDLNKKIKQQKSVKRKYRR